MSITKFVYSLCKHTPILTAVKDRQGKPFWLLCAFSVFVTLYISSQVVHTVQMYQDMGSEDNLVLYRDMYRQQAWPQVEGNVTTPGFLPATAHVFWCGRGKMFRFEDYLSVLSVVRVLQPHKLVFHYSNLPQVDDMWYHTWFQELKQSVPNLVLSFHLSLPQTCGSVEALRYYLSFLEEEEEGGIYIGGRTVVTRFPEKELKSSDLFYSFREDEMNQDFTKGIVIAKRRLSKDDVSAILHSVTKGGAHAPKCWNSEEYNAEFIIQSFTDEKDILQVQKQNAPTPPQVRIKSPLSSHPSPSLSSSSSSLSSSPCLVIFDSVYPKDIMTSATPFAELARWLFYGNRRTLEAEPDPPEVPLVPLFSHIVWMKPTDILKSAQFKFLHFLSVMSALHVASMQHVYIHGSVEPYGPWWDALQGQNVTFVKISPPDVIFQQSVRGPAHQSDVIRLRILHTWGGVYQDRDVIWTSPLSEEVRRYPVSVCPDWPENGEWPEVFNMGVFAAKPGAEWLGHFLDTFRYYRDDKWAFNAVFMPYKAYEFHPDKVHIDRHLQIICFRSICHPAWHTDYKRNIYDTRPVQDFHWSEGRSFHFTVPKPAPGLASVEAIRDGKDMFSEIGRMILKKSNMEHLLLS